MPKKRRIFKKPAAHVDTGKTDKSPETPDGKSREAVLLGRKGGQARARKLAARRRTEIARKAAEARWKKKN